MAHQSWKPSQGAPNQFRTFSLGPDRADRPLAGQHIVVGLQPGVSQVLWLWRLCTYTLLGACFLMLLLTAVLLLSIIVHPDLGSYSHGKLCHVAFMAYNQQSAFVELTVCIRLHAVCICGHAWECAGPLQGPSTGSACCAMGCGELGSLAKAARDRL